MSVSHVLQLIDSEGKRQLETLQLIASENFTSPEVMSAQGSVLTNKYAEGYPGKRYYAGCEVVDQIEEIAIDRAKELFHAGYANVQSHSGSQANAAVYLGLLNPGDTILSMSMDAGGHLSHGSSVNMVSKYYRCIAYGLTDNHDVDYDQVRELAHKHKPKLIIAGYSAFTNEIQWSLFREIADEVGAYLLADIAHTAGMIVTGLMNHPFPHAHVCTSTTHKTLRGPRSGVIVVGDDEGLFKKINRAVFPGIQGGPLMHVVAAKAIAFTKCLELPFKNYQRRVLRNAKILAEALQQHGLSLIGHGTENHQVIIDLRQDDHAGAYYEKMCEQVGIILNKNCVFKDPRSPMQTSGLRLGTPALTTRGMGEEDMRQVAGWLAEVILKKNTSSDLKREIAAYCLRFPIYSE